MTGPAPRGRRARASTLLFSAVPRENLIEDDGAERCGANPSHREGPELECEVAGPCRKRDSDGDQISWIGEIYLILYPDPACHGGDQAKQHDRQSTDDGTWDRENQSTEFWREAQQDRDDGSNDKQKSGIDLCSRHHTDVLGVSRHAGAAAEGGNNRGQAVSQKSTAQEAIEASARHRADRFDVA